MNQQEAIKTLDPEWERPGGFFAKIRDGHFDITHARSILNTIKNLELGSNQNIDRRLVRLLWYLPSFCGWQEERIEEEGGDVDAFNEFVTQLTNELENKLGVP